MHILDILELYGSFDEYLAIELHDEFDKPLVCSIRLKERNFLQSFMAPEYWG